jgi:adenylate cyclase
MIGARRFTVRLGIVSLITTLLLISGGVIIVATYVGGTNALQLLAGDLIREISSHVRDRTIHYLEPASNNIDLIHKVVGGQEIDIEDQDRLYTFFRNILSTHEQVVMVYMGYPSGNLIMAKKMPDGSISERRIVRDEDNHRVVTHYRHNSEAMKEAYPDTSESLKVGYDPRARGWYQKAVNESGIVWTDPYIFASDHRPGLSSAAAIRDTRGRLKGVISVDIEISGLSNFLADLQVGESGKAFIIKQDRTVAVPAKGPVSQREIFTEVGDDVYELRKVTQLEDPVIAEAYEAFRIQGRDSDGSSAAIARHQGGGFIDLNFEHDGETYFAVFAPFAPDSGLDWLIGVVIPESDVLGRIREKHMLTIYGSILFLVLSILAGARLSKLISRPLVSLTREMERVKQFDLEDIREIRSPLYEVNQMGLSFSRMTNGLRSFRKFVPSDLVLELLQLNKEAVAGGEAKELTIFFSDIKDFTSISEKLEPDELVEFLSEYLEEMSQIIISHRGTVDKYIGDAIMAFWNAPRDLENHELWTVRAALRFQDRLTELNRKWQQLGKPEFRTRIGINTGVVIVGNMGASERLNYTVVGDAVNLASRLEGLNKIYNTSIIISEHTNSRIEHEIASRLLDFVAVKGKTRAVAIYEPVGERSTLNARQERLIDLYHKAVEHYRLERWSQAITVLEAIRRDYPDDGPSDVLLERCRGLSQAGVPDDWDGTQVYSDK